MMNRAALAIVLACTLLPAGVTLAREPYDDLFFVKRGGTGAQMFADRASCRHQAVTIGGGGSGDYSNPNYGALAAMGQALDSDQLHSEGIGRRMQLAVLNSCMKDLGWTPLQPAEADARAVSRASERHPDALDGWIKAHEPPAPPPAPVPAAAAAPAVQAAPGAAAAVAAGTPPSTPKP